MKAWKRDIIISCVLLVLCVCGYIHCENLGGIMQKYKMAQAGSYAEFWLITIGLLAVALLVRTLIQRPQETAAKVWTKVMLLTVAVCILYLVLMPIIGFNISTCLFLYALSIAYNQANEKKRLSGKALKIALVKWFVVAICMTAFLYFAFAVLLNASLPMLGILGI